MGEMRTAVSVVENRYSYMVKEAALHGQPMREELIPKA